MKNETLRKLVLSAMFAALCCVATSSVQFPSVAGYTTLGECMCLLGGLVRAVIPCAEHSAARG